MNIIRRVILEAGYFRARVAYIAARVARDMALDNLRRDLGLPSTVRPGVLWLGAVVPFCVLYSVEVPRSPKAIRALAANDEFRRMARRVLEV